MNLQEKAEKAMFKLQDLGNIEILSPKVRLYRLTVTRVLVLLVNPGNKKNPKVCQIFPKKIQA